MSQTIENEDQIEIVGEGAATPIYGIEIINRVIKALYNYKKPATYKDLASHSGLHLVTTSQALSSSRDVGLTRLAGKKGLYDLSPEGIDYARFLTAGKEDDAHRTLRQIILGNRSWSEVVSFLRTNENRARDPTDIVLAVERKLGKQWSQAMRAKVADSYASILSYAGLVRIESGNIIPLLAQDMDQADHSTIVDRARGRDFFSTFSGSDWPTAVDLRRAADSMEPPRPDFVEHKDENYALRVRKDLQSIAQVRLYLDFLEKDIELKRKTAREHQVDPQQPE